MSFSIHIGYSLKLIATLLLLLISTDLKAQIMLGATFAEVKQAFCYKSPYFRWREGVTDDGTAYASFANLKEQNLQIYYYFEGGKSIQITFLGVFDEYWQQFNSFCNKKLIYQSSNKFMDKASNLTYFIGANIPDSKNPEHKNWTASLTIKKTKVISKHIKGKK